jgi:hypothetical protein
MLDWNARIRTDHGDGVTRLRMVDGALADAEYHNLDPALRDALTGQ